MFESARGAVGCGCGRVAAPLQRLAPNSRISGTDVDAPAVEWCQRRLPGTYRVGSGRALPFADGEFEVVYAVSVFTHLSEADQFHWLKEIHRTLRPAGLLVATTLAPSLVHTRADLGAAHVAELERTGFLFAPGPGPFNDDSAFHAAGYLERAWSPWFALLSHREHGLVGYQDLAVFRRRDE